MNDLPFIAQKCSIQKLHRWYKTHFLFTSFELKDNLDAITDLKDYLFKIEEWCCNNLLLLNPGKTKFMIFGSRYMCAKLHFHSLLFMGKDIIPTNTTKDLGVNLDSNLTYNEHN